MADEVVKTNWPVRLYLGSLVWALLTLLVFTPTLSGPIVNAARGQSQFAIAGILLLRLGWAYCRHEQSKIWIAYVICMILAVPIWLIVEPMIFALGR